MTESSSKPDWMPLSDVTAVARARDGDRDAFRTLVERHSRAVFRLAHRMTGNREDAEDIVQDAFTRAYRQLGQFESRSSFATWMHRITVNCAIDFLRSRSGHRDAVLDDERLQDVAASASSPHQASPERLARSREVKDAVLEAMESLSSLERAAFMLRHFEGRSLQEIGDRLGLGTSATKHSIFRAVRKMRVALAEFAEV